MPVKNLAVSIESGAKYNLTEFFMCAHNGTHIDAPYHFFKDGTTVDGISLDKFCGKCYVASCDEELDEVMVQKIISKARSADAGCAKRILIKGKGVVTVSGAKAFANENTVLVGSEYQSVGPENAPMAVHLELLGAEVVLLEGIRLEDVTDGVYFLCAQPINLGGCDGAPCRAILIK